MVGRRTLVASALILVLILPMAASTLVVNEGRGGYDADGVWTESVELPLHHAVSYTHQTLPTICSV